MACGDHIFYYRAAGTYSHHGIDCGDGTVVHYESSPWIKLAGTLAPDRSPCVRRVSWELFSLGSPVLVRRYEICDEPATVLERAESRIGEQCYDLFGNNCEHFAVWCKTGRARSTQAEAFLHAMRTVAGQTPVATTLLRYARRLPGVYRVWAYAGAAGLVSVVFTASYLRERQRSMLEYQS